MNKGLHRKHEIHLSKKEKIVLKAQFNKDWKTPIFDNNESRSNFLLFLFVSLGEYFYKLRFIINF